jgi:hypothetical protein
MDFSMIGFGEVYENEQRAHRMANAAKWHAGIFTIFATNLLISILRTISTSPGTIPDYKEWDMNTATDSLDEEHIAELAKSKIKRSN